ncbi:MAG: tetratricopeptide repeat protein, partial [Myxococcota bacterium]
TDPESLQKALKQAIADGDAYLGAKQYAKAQQSYRAALNYDAGSEEAYYKLGLAFALGGDYAGAAAAFERVLALNPRNTSARQNLERARAKMATRPAGADSAFDKAEDAYIRGVGLMRSGDYVGALAAFDETLRYRQDHALCYVARGTAFVALRDPRRAVVEYNKALTFDPSLSAPYFGLAEAYRQAGDNPRAVQYYTHYVNSKGRDKDAATVDRANRWIAELSR